MGSKMRQFLNDYFGTLEIDTENVGDIGVAGKPRKYKCLGFKCKKYHEFDVVQYDDHIEDLDLNKKYYKYKDYFDVLFCTEVFDHIVNPAQAIENIYSMLKKGGVLYLSVAFIYPQHGEKDYLRYTNHGLMKLFKDANFSKIKVTNRVATDGLEHLKKFYEAEGMLVEENYHDLIGFIVKAIK